jgi:gliding motility-associated-like protein
LSATSAGYWKTGTYTWQPGGKTGQTITISPKLDSAYVVTYNYGPNNACKTKDTVNVIVHPVPSVSAIISTPPGDTLCLGATIHLKASVSPAGTGIVWTENGKVLPGKTTDSLSIVSNADVGTATYAITATNQFGCTSAQKEISFEFRRCFEMPNVFTPNSDQLNDQFGPLFLGASTEIVLFSIYDRWGKKVFEGNRNTPAWDGMSDGKEAPSDVYVYHIIIRYANGAQDEKKGSVTLLR